MRRTSAACSRTSPSNRASSIAASDVGGQAAAERALSGSLGRLMAVAEAYPQLKADKNFLDLQAQLSEIEDQIQMARRYYNGTVRNLNISIQSFPDVLLARPLGFKEEPFFELERPRRGGGAAGRVPGEQAMSAICRIALALGLLLAALGPPAPSSASCASSAT